MKLLFRTVSAMFLSLSCLRPNPAGAFAVAAFSTTTRRTMSHRGSIFLPSSLRMASTAPDTPAKNNKKKKNKQQLDVTQVILKRNQQSKAFRNGNQLVFTRSIQKTTSAVEPGLADLVQVLVCAHHDDDAQPPPVALGYGVYNPHSLYRVRILCHGFLQPALYARVAAAAQPVEALEHIVRHHLQTAVATRRALQLPQKGGKGAVTDTYRLVNGEGDQLSGLAVDMIDTTAVVMSSAAWCEIHKDVILQSLQEELPTGTSIVWKTTPSRLVQDGYDMPLTKEEPPVDDEDPLADQVVISTENGIKYKTYPYSDGQKTGVYCDQRENRWNLATFCRDKRVLDLCCYHGGFSLNALINGGALSCVGVDSSPDAIAACCSNAELNGYSANDGRIQFVRSDITAFLQESAGQAVYDVIVLDPPKLAPSAAGLDKARRKYHSFNRDAIKLIAPQGGLLLTCTCSAAMTQKDGGQYFLSMVQGAAQATGRQVTLLRVSGAASCHTQSPISWPAGAYLTAALFYVHPIE